MNSDRVTRENRRGVRGFTLLEMLAALVVMSIAVSIFFQMFLGAVKLKDDAAKSRAAARVAEKVITEIKANPSQYEWPRYEEAAAGTLIPLMLRGAGNTHVAIAGGPSELPPERRANERTQSLYNNLTTETYTSMSSPDAHHASVIVVVKWSVEGRQQAFSLTTTVPRSVAEG